MDRDCDRRDGSIRSGSGSASPKADFATLRRRLIRKQMRRVAALVFPRGTDYTPRLREWILAIAVHLELDLDAPNGRHVTGVLGEAIRCGIRGVPREVAHEAVQEIDALYWSGKSLGEAIDLLPAVRDAAEAWQITSPYESNADGRRRRRREKQRVAWRRQKRAQRDRARKARPPKPLTSKQIAEMHGWSPAKAWRWRKAGRVDPITGAIVSDVKKTCPPGKRDKDISLTTPADRNFSSVAQVAPARGRAPEGASPPTPPTTSIRVLIFRRAADLAAGRIPAPPPDDAGVAGAGGIRPPQAPVTAARARRR